MTSSLAARIAFASLHGINRTLAESILSRVGTEEEFFRLPERTLASLLGFKNKLLGEGYRQSLLEKAKAETDFIAAHNIRTMYFTDVDYPVRLADCDDAPLMLFGSGQADLNSRTMISIVGTRHATAYGIDFVNRLVRELSETLENPPAIISGLAFGIDIAAHRAALDAGLPTVAVMAHGLNTVYPSQHRSTAARIVKEGGMVVSEYMSSSPIHKGNFVARNRIVAGMCDCIVVAESATKGGALITANIASAYNRDVFALPGRISDRYSAGCNELISSNIAALVTGAEQLSSAMGWSTIEKEGDQGTLFGDLSQEELDVLDFLERHPDSAINDISVNIGRPVAKLLALMIEMEFKGLILAFPGGRYRKN